jgi:hypothetical protein
VRCLRTARLVKTTLSRSTNAQQLKIKSARIGDFVFVRLAIARDLFSRTQSSRRHIPILAVDKIEQMLTHETHVTLRSIRRNRIIFVEIERRNLRKVEPVAKPKTAFGF